MRKTTILSLLMVTTLTACGSGKGPLARLGTSPDGLNYESEALKNFNTNFNYDGLKEIEGKILDAIKSGNVLRTSHLLDERNYQINLLLDKQLVANARYQSNLNQSYKERSDELLAAYDESLDWEYGAEKMAYETGNRNIYELFFEDMTAEEIEEYLYTTDLSEEAIRANELQRQMDEISLRIDLDYGMSSKEEYIAEGIEALYEFCPLADELASIYGYESYLDMAYESDYSRTYTHEDGYQMSQNVKEIILPNYQKMNSQGYTQEEKDLINNTYLLPFSHPDVNLGDSIDQYAKTVGGEFYDIYKSVFETGYFIFSNNANALGTAYETYLYTRDNFMLYFSEENQDASNIVHEFGHGFADQVNELNQYRSLDIYETHSQGDEVLYLTYLSTQYNKKYKSYAKYFVNKLFSYLLLYSSIIEIEEYFFNNYKTITDHEVMTENIYNILNSYDEKIDISYWVYPVLCYPGYYVSYLTSDIAVLNLYDNAQENFRNAVNDYVGFVKEEDLTLTDPELWSKYNFGSPMEKESLTELLDILKTVI